MQHVDYPHVPGQLYDCEACEAKCHCEYGSTKCVYSGAHKTRQEKLDAVPFGLLAEHSTPGLADDFFRYHDNQAMLVLDGGPKTVVLANEAMGRLLGMLGEEEEEDDNAGQNVASMVLGRLHGQSLSQVGIDMLQDGRPVWVPWENFLDSLQRDVGALDATGENNAPEIVTKNGTGSLAGEADERGSDFEIEGPTGQQQTTRPPAQNIVVEVIITRRNDDMRRFGHCLPR